MKTLSEMLTEKVNAKAAKKWVADNFDKMDIDKLEKAFSKKFGDDIDAFEQAVADYLDK